MNNRYQNTAFTLVELPFGRLRTSRRRKGKAFTLVELLVVVAIIALLVSILLPSLGSARQMTLCVLCAGNLRQIDVAMNMYLNDHNDVYPCAEDPVSTDPFYWLWMGRGWRGLVEPYFGTKVSESNPSVLFCPADKAAKDKYEATSYAYSMSFYHSPEQIDAMNTAADTYSNPQPSVAQQSCDVARPSGKIIIGEWTSNHRPIHDDKGWWCREGERNYLFADGQVRYLKATEIRDARDGWPDPNLTVGGISGTDMQP